MKAYAGLYCEPLRMATRYLKASSQAVLLQLLSHSDHLGRSYPKQITISINSGLSLSTVGLALDELEELAVIGILQHAYRHQLTGRYEPTIFMISPYLLFMPEKFLTEANQLWDMARHGRHSELPYVWVTTVQEGRETTEIQLHKQQQKHHSEAEPTKQHQKQHSTTTERPESQRLTVEYANYLEDQTTNSEQQKQNGYHHTDETVPARKQTTAKAKTPPVSAAPPKVKQGMPAPINEPLDMMGEMVAAKLNRLGIPMPLSRGFAKKFGNERIDKAIAIATKPGAFDKVAGGVIYLLRTIGIDANDKADQPVIEQREGQDTTVLENGNRYTTGKYAGFIES